jgi:N-ethylmaleimide reductase
MKLLEKTKIGSIELKNRVVMAPMTRSRATAEGLVTKATVLYYKQRATAGLIISEGVNISEQALGSPYTPGIYSHAQIEAWRNVTEAVHAEGGKIFMQLWHTGRVSHSSIKNGELPVAPSAIRIEGQKHFTPTGMQDYEVPRALETQEVKKIIKQYGIAAQNAKDAGFDGVELHGAFGYLPNQFLVDSANKRTDEYGGSIENRSRFVLEIMQELVKVWGDGKAGIKLSPSIPINAMIDSDPKSLFTYLISELNKLPLAYLHLMNALVPLNDLPHYPTDVFAAFGGLFDKPIIANGRFSRDSAEQEILNRRAQLVSFGALYVANPDLVKRFELNEGYNEPDRSAFYGGGEKGYTDYPILN